jgi:hypothetical protein
MIGKDSNDVLNSERDDSGEMSLLFAKEYPKRKTVGLKEACQINRETTMATERR